MSRTPLSWEEWGAPAYAVAKPAYDYAAAAAARELKKSEEAAARAAELASLRRSRDDAAQQASDSAAAAAAAASAAKKQLVRLQATYDSRIAAMEAKAAEALAAAATAAAADAGAGGAGGALVDGEASLCIVCLDAPRRVALQPCGHNSFCRGCAGEVMRLGHGRCPVCRSPVKVAQEIFE